MSEIGFSFSACIHFLLLLYKIKQLGTTQIYYLSVLWVRVSASFIFITSYNQNVTRIGSHQEALGKKLLPGSFRLLADHARCSLRLQDRDSHFFAGNYSQLLEPTHILCLALPFPHLQSQQHWSRISHTLPPLLPHLSRLLLHHSVCLFCLRLLPLRIHGIHELMFTGSTQIVQIFLLILKSPD